jgi:hypothetical protein
MEKKRIIFITGLHNKSQGCGASVASAAGTFTTKRKLAEKNDMYTLNDLYYYWTFVALFSMQNLLFHPEEGANRTSETLVPIKLHAIIS